MTASPLPILRMKPKADARRIRHGHPWAWSDELVLDRRARAVPDGALAVLEDSDRQQLGVGIASVSGKIGMRLLDRDATAQIDEAWLRARVDAAARARMQAYATPHYRLIHAEGDGLVGLIVDRFDDTVVVQPNARWLEERLDTLCAILRDIDGVETVVLNGTSRARLAEGLPEEVRILHGTPPIGPIPVLMNGATYMADVMTGQKTGLFYDQRPNHAFAASIAANARVLDVFSHVGGFGLAALAAGARHATCIDGSAPALELAQSGAEAMGKAAQIDLRCGDAFAEMERLLSEEAKFEIVICDPPAFAPAKTSLQPGLRAYERVARLASGLVAPGGTIVLCSCSHAADLSKFRAACLRGIGRAGRDPRLIYTGFAGPDHPQHPMLTETGYLKVLAFRMLG